VDRAVEDHEGFELRTRLKTSLFKSNKALTKNENLSLCWLGRNGQSAQGMARYISKWGSSTSLQAGWLEDITNWAIPDSDIAKTGCDQRLAQSYSSLVG
jgi:hypothetical protein